MPGQQAAAALEKMAKRLTQHVILMHACTRQQSAAARRHDTRHCLAVQAINNPAYNCEAAGTADSCESAQPWQLAAVQTAADFGDSNEEAAERYVHAAALLSGMLHPHIAQRMTAKQLASDSWLRQAGSSALGECPLVW